MASNPNSLAVAYNRSGLFLRPNCTYTADEECFKMHWHDRFELIVIRKGSLFVDFGDRTALVPSDSVVIIPPRQSHSTVAGESGVCFDSVSFDLRFFYNQTTICSKLFPLIFKERMKFQIFSNSKEIVSSVVSLLIKSGTESEQLKIVGEVYNLISLLLDTCIIEITDNNEKDSDFASVIEYMNANYQSDIGTSKLCETFGYTKPYFCRRFKEYTGVTPMLYLTSRRLEAACELLQKSNKSIGEISALCGFNDPNYFARCFKGHFGTSPAEYRKQFKR